MKPGILPSYGSLWRVFSVTCIQCDVYSVFCTPSLPIPLLILPPVPRFCQWIRLCRFLFCFVCFSRCGPWFIHGYYCYVSAFHAVKGIREENTVCVCVCVCYVGVWKPIRSGQSGDQRDRKSCQITAAVKFDLRAGSGVGGGVRFRVLFSYDRPCMTLRSDLKFHCRYFIAVDWDLSCLRSKCVCVCVCGN